MKRPSAFIGILTASALVMAVALILLPVAPPQARAENATVGDYTLIASAPVVGGDDYITVIDNREGKMLSYQVNNIQANASLELVGYMDLVSKAGGR